MTWIMKHALLALAATASLTFASSSLAAGGDGDATQEQCKEGQVYDKATQKCVDQSGQLNDDTIYDAARQLAFAGKYDSALKMLKRASNQNDPKILTYYGYTNRKLGNIDLAMNFYNRAISADANNLLARSYMGQGLVQQGKLEEARAQLVEIRDRGGKGTYAYQALYEALKSGSMY